MKMMRKFLQVLKIIIRKTDNMMNKTYLLICLLFLIILNCQIGLAKIDDELHQCIDTLLLKEPGISKVIGVKKFSFNDSVWFVLALQSISKIEPQTEIICYQEKSGDNLSWQKVEYYDPTVPTKVSDFYVSYIQSREPDFDSISQPIFIGDTNAEIMKETNVNKLNVDQLMGYSDFSLNLIANEILARHGAVFKEPILNSFFSTRKWYKPNKSFDRTKLTVIEKKNLEVIEKYRKSLKVFDLNDIAKLFFGNLKYEKIPIGDINKDGKEEILVGIPIASNKKIYNKAMVLRNENGKYIILLKFSSLGVFGKNEEFLCAIPGKKQVKWKINFDNDLLVSFMDTNLQPIFDQIMLSWSKKADKYYLSMIP
jgi:hypothetical protein